MRDIKLSNEVLSSIQDCLYDINLGIESGKLTTILPLRMELEVILSVLNRLEEEVS